MRELDLETAVREIVATTKRKQAQLENGESGYLPFFFIVGAGISHPPIPLAEGIEKLCQDEIQRTDGRLPSPDLAPLDRYAATFEAAFPNAEERQDFLHDLIDKKPISAANLRLAHLLGARTLTNLVVTPNFDEMLSQALRLLGYHDAVVCDHPKTTQRIRLNRTSQIQIVHVHGTHWFYDCCNLRGEIETRAEHDEQDELSMLALLDKALGERSPIVVGYAGWEGDVIMSALKRRLRHEILPHNLYWFCYRRGEAETLPSWLRNHVSVRVVLPPISRPEEAEGHLLPAVAGGQTEPSRDSVLPAARTLGAFIQHMELPQPPLTGNPLSFIAGALKINLELAAAEEEDIYLLREVLRRVEHGALWEAESRTATTEERRWAINVLSRVNDAVRRLALQEAVDLAATIDLRSLTPEERKGLDSTLDKVIREVGRPDAEIGLAACDMRLRLCDVASRGDDAAGPWNEQMARTLRCKGYLHDTKRQYKEAVAAYDEVLRRFGGSHEASLRVEVAKSLICKGQALCNAPDLDGAQEAWEEVIHRFRNDPDAAVQEQVGIAFIHKGVGGPW